MQATTSEHGGEQGPEVYKSWKAVRLWNAIFLDYMHELTTVVTCTGHIQDPTHHQSVKKDREPACALPADPNRSSGSL